MAKVGWEVAQRFSALAFKNGAVGSTSELGYIVKRSLSPLLEITTQL